MNTLLTSEGYNIWTPELIFVNTVIAFIIQENASYLAFLVVTNMEYSQENVTYFAFLVVTNMNYAQENVNKLYLQENKPRTVTDDKTSFTV